MVYNDELLEYATVFHHMYGTPRKMVETELGKGNDVLFDIDWQGARQIREKFKPDDLVMIFILPPSIAELRSRLERRRQDSNNVLEQRMSQAQAEISHFSEYDFVVVNHDIEKTYDEIRSIILSKRQQRIDRNMIEDFILNNLTK